MAKQVLNNGETHGVIRGKINDNFTELYTDIEVHKAESANYGEFTISANQSIPTTSSTQILFNTTVKANPSLYELQPSGKVKILKAGTYEVKLIVTFAANATGFRRTNNISKQMTVPAVTGVNISVFSSALFDASLNYETATTVTQTSGGALDLIAGQLQTCLQIRKVS